MHKDASLALGYLPYTSLNRRQPYRWAHLSVCLEKGCLLRVRGHDSQRGFRNVQVSTQHIVYENLGDLKSAQLPCQYESRSPLYAEFQALYRKNKSFELDSLATFCSPAHMPRQRISSRTILSYTRRRGRQLPPFNLRNVLDEPIAVFEVIDIGLPSAFAVYSTEDRATFASDYSKVVKYRHDLAKIGCSSLARSTSRELRKWRSEKNAAVFDERPPRWTQIIKSYTQNRFGYEAHGPRSAGCAWPPPIRTEVARGPPMLDDTDHLEKRDNIHQLRIPAVVSEQAGAVACLSPRCL
jgi:hypothetical protein